MIHYMVNSGIMSNKVFHKIENNIYKNIFEKSKEPNITLNIIGINGNNFTFNISEKDLHSPLFYFIGDIIKKDIEQSNFEYEKIEYPVSSSFENKCEEKQIDEPKYFEKKYNKNGELEEEEEKKDDDDYTEYDDYTDDDVVSEKEDNRKEANYTTTNTEEEYKNDIQKFYDIKECKYNFENNIKKNEKMMHKEDKKEKERIKFLKTFGKNKDNSFTNNDKMMIFHNYYTYFQLRIVRDIEKYLSEKNGRVNDTGKADGDDNTDKDSGKDAPVDDEEDIDVIGKNNILSFENFKITDTLVFELNKLGRCKNFNKTKMCPECPVLYSNIIFNPIICCECNHAFTNTKKIINLQSCPMCRSDDFYENTLMDKNEHTTDLYWTRFVDLKEAQFIFIKIVSKTRFYDNGKKFDIIEIINEIENIKKKAKLFQLIEKHMDYLYL